MAIADAQRTAEAIQTVALAGGAGCMGVVALCGELVRAGVLEPEAVQRVREAMLGDISASPAPFLAKQNLQHAIQGKFAEILPRSE